MDARSADGSVVVGGQYLRQSHRERPFEQSNDLTYTPRPLKLLAALARVCAEVKTRLASELNSIEQQTPATLRKPACRPSTAVGILLAGLAGSTKPDVVRGLARLTPADTARLTTLSRSRR